MDDTISRLIHTLYAGLSEPGWAQPFLEGVCRATGSHAGALVVSDLIHQRDAMPAFFGAQNASALDYERRYAGHNPWRQAHALRPSEAGSVVVSDDLVPFSELKRSLFWTDFLHHLDIDHGAGLVGVSSAQHLGSLTVLRSRARGPYRGDDLTVLRQISAHWANACRLRARLDLIGEGERTLATALDYVGSAVLLLNGAGLLVRTNAAGDALLQNGGVLCLRGGRPTARHGTSTAALARAIEAILTSGALPTALVPLHNAEGRLAAQAGVHRMALEPSNTTVRAVLLVQPLRQDCHAALRDALHDVYALTQREAQLATQLNSGLNLVEAAAALSITTEHARTRFKVVCQKLGVNSRADALRLMETLGTSLGHPGDKPVRD